jgi:hypothetical protein
VQGERRNTGVVVAVGLDKAPDGASQRALARFYPTKAPKRIDPLKIRQPFMGDVISDPVYLENIEGKLEQES